MTSLLKESRRVKKEKVFEIWMSLSFCDIIRPEETCVRLSQCQPGSPALQCFQAWMGFSYGLFLFAWDLFIYLVLLFVFFLCVCCIFNWLNKEKLLTYPVFICCDLLCDVDCNSCWARLHLHFIFKGMNWNALLGLVKWLCFVFILRKITSC